MGIRSVSAEPAIINLHPIDRGRRGPIVGGNIRLALCAERLPFCITIMSITPTTTALTKSATSLFVWKSAAVTAPSMSNLFGKHDFKRMRYPVQMIITALSMFYLGKNSFRNISLILKTAFNIKVSHTTVSN